MRLGSVVALEPIAGNVMGLEVLAIPGQRMGPGRVRHFVSGHEWWNQIVHILGRERRSRGEIVLFAANQDGGSHVDAELEPFGSRLIEGMWTQVIPRTASDPSGSVRLTDHHLTMLRTMATELLSSPDLLALGV